MKKSLTVIFTLIFLMLIMSSCQDGDVPDGMKLASDTSLVEYTLYVPSGWIIDSMDTVSSAHVSDSDRTGISVKKTGSTSIDSWWHDYKTGISSTFKDLTLITEGGDCVIDTLNAKKYVFTASFNNQSYYKYEIIAVEKSGSVYEIMVKYQGIKKDSKLSYSDENHAKTVAKILENFKFNDTLTDKNEISYEANGVPEGMKCASNSKIVDYYLFVPTEWKIDKTVGTVSSAYVSESDKTNVSVMQWNYTGSYERWWNEYLLQLYSTFDYSAIPLKENGEAQADENGKINYLPSEILSVSNEISDTKLGEADAKKYCYSAKIDGSVYDFTVISTIHRGSVYVFTLTLKSGSDASLYEADLTKILQNFRFI